MYVCMTAAAAADAGRSHTPSPRYNTADITSPLVATAADADVCRVDVTTLTRPRSLSALNSTPAQPPSSPSQSPSPSLSSSSSAAAAAAASEVTCQRVRSGGATRPARITAGMYTVSQKNIPDVFSYNSRKH